MDRGDRGRADRGGRLTALWRLAGFASLLAGAIGVIVPLLPTVPFVILAAACFAKGSPALEARLLEHPRFGPHIVLWRERRAISRKGKYAAFAAFAVSIALALAFAPFPWSLAPVVAAVITGSWMWTRPER